MSRPSRLLSSNVVNMLLSGGVGLLVGVLIGVSIGSDGDAEQPGKRPRPEAPKAPSRGKPAQQPAKQALLPDFDLDIGTKAAKSVLSGGWKTQPREDGRSSALLPSKNARVAFAIAPKAAPYALAVVGKATGADDAAKLEVVVSLNKTKLSTWSLDDSWSLQWAPIPPDALTSASTELHFEARRPDHETEGRAASQATAVFDHLRVEPLLATAGVDLRTAAGRARLLSGFHAVAGLNGAGDKPTRPGVWSRGKRSRVGLLLAPNDGTYQLKLRGSAYDHVAPLKVKVRINGEAAAELSLETLKDYTVDIEPGRLRRGANLVEFRYPRTARPADVEPDAKDTRELAMLLYDLSLAPKAPRPARPAARQ